MYGRKVKAADLLAGKVPQPVEAEPLYRMLQTSRFALVGETPDAEASEADVSQAKYKAFNKSSSDTDGSQVRLSETTINAEAVHDKEAVDQRRAKLDTLKAKLNQMSSLKKNAGPSSNEKPSLAKAIALYDFNAQQAGDLSFKKGDYIFITQSKPGDDWWTGRSGTADGIFPRNYVQVIND